MRISDEGEGEGTTRRRGAVRPLSAVSAVRLARRRPTKLQLVMLAGVALLTLGPIGALVATVTHDADPLVTLAQGGTPPVDGAQLSVTLVGVVPSTGELRGRIAVHPQFGMLDNDRLADDLVLRVNDIRGQDTYEFPAGAPLRPIDVGLALEGGSVERYPFDRYDATLVLTLVATRPGSNEPVDFSLDVVSNVDDFDVSSRPVGIDDGGEVAAAPLAAVDFDISREFNTMFYATWTMVLMWALAIVGVGILWAVIIWQVEVPWWGLGYFVGVLFALPQLREVLPGRPPPGTLLDFVAFYWSVAILGISLILLLAIWIQRSRPLGSTEVVELLGEGQEEAASSWAGTEDWDPDHHSSDDGEPDHSEEARGSPSS